tara:strand:- start:344 stop:580 length:237 start_codon:yes stop_codon:yes gene_type:complete
MKTLVRPQPHSTIAISTDKLKYKKILRNQKFNARVHKKNVCYMMLFASLAIFLLVPESPKLSESICTSYNQELVCNIW